MHHVSKDELRQSHPDDVHGLVDVGDDAAYLGARVPAGFGAQARARSRCCRSCSRDRDAEQPWRRSNRSHTGWTRSWLGLKDWIPHSAIFGKPR